MIIIPSTFLLPYFVSHHLFLDLHSTFYTFPTYWYTFLIWYLLHIIHMFHWWFDHLSFFLFRHRHFLWLPLGPWLMRFFYALHLVHEGMGLIIGYLSLVSFHLFHLITLADITSLVLRPPWGHEIRCYLWQPLLRLVFGIWLTYRRHPVSSFGRCFFYAWRWFSDGCRRLLHLMDDIWRFLASHSTVYQLSYWGIFPFHLVEMSPYFEPRHFHRSEIPNGVCWDDICSSGTLLSSLTIFMILGSICGIFFRWTSGLLLSWR